MTDNEIELALETIALVLEDLKKTQEKQQSTITAIEKALAEHALRETQRLGQEIEQEPVAQPERHELQAKGEHPAPCARHCEANAFQIVIKNLKAQLAQPEQEPAVWIHNFIEGGISIGKRPTDLNRHPDRWTALYKDPKPCPTCEALARTVMLDQTSHDTTPPQRKPLTEEDCRTGFREQDAKWTFRNMTAWQVWRTACEWNEAAHGIKENT